MIKIDRTRIAPPPELIEAAGDEAVRAKEFYTDPNNIRYGKSFQFKAYHSGGVRESLLELFHDKCAFCESKLGVSSQLDIEQFRPKAMAINHDGSIDKPGYWWLAWEWSNLYPACPLCNRTKANRFPVVGSRAEQVEAGSNRNTINPADNPLQAVAIYSEGKLAITVSEDGAIDYCDLETAKISLSIKSGISDPSFVAATPDGKRVVFASQDGQWVIWDSNRITPETDWEVFSTDDRLRGIAISPDGRRVILAAGESLQVWDDKVREMVQLLEGHSDWVNALAISPDGRMVISAAEDTTLGVWDLESGEELRTLRGHERPVYGVGITADGKRVISLSVFGTLRVWDLESGEQLFEIEGDGYGYKSLAISADGRFAVCRQQRNLRVMDLHTRQERVRISHHGAQINDATTTPDGRFVLTAGSDGALEIWNLHSIGAEKALILDPCHDDPENYLVFREDGLVASVPPDSESLTAQDGKRYKGLDRGQITIDTFGLNRAELVEERRLAAKQLRQQVQDALGGGDPDDPIIGEIIQTKVNDLLSPHHAYAAIRRQLLPRFIDEIREEMQIEERLETEKGLEMTDSVDQEIDQYAVKDEVYDEAFRKFETRTSQREAKTPDEVEDSDVFIRSAMVSRVEIKNFQCLDTLSFDFSGGSENRMSWKVLLGENGVGKSSVLEAVALALMGKKYFDSIEDIEPDTLLKRGTKGGYIKVHFSTDINPIEVEITTDGLAYPSSETGLRTYLSGFGSARWLPRKGSMEYERDPNVRVRNLFNPFVPLTDAINILISMKEKQWYKRLWNIERALNKLLQFDLETRFPLREKTIYIQFPGQKFSTRLDRLDQLSDGYQTVLAIGVTIMNMVGELWGYEMENAEGIVLLDEIGAHLHPRWKLRIVDSLRSAFPRMQFLAATHEPLCLRGLFDNEILLLRKVDGEIKVTDNIESPDTLSIDQLLRSPLFGMLTTFDPDTERDFERYYAILSKPESLRAEDQQDLDELRTQLGEKGVLAEMTRKQIAYQVIDQQLEDQLAVEEKFDPEAIKPETRNLITDIWDEI